MAELRLARVDTVHTVTETVRQGAQPRQQRHEMGGRRRPAHNRLVGAIYPAGDPDRCEVDYVVDATGILTAILVRDTSTGVVLARVEAEELARLQGKGDSAGLLYERRG